MIDSAQGVRFVLARLHIGRLTDAPALSLVNSGAGRKDLTEVMTGDTRHGGVKPKLNLSIDGPCVEKRETFWYHLRAE